MGFITGSDGRFTSELEEEDEEEEFDACRCCSFCE